MFVTHGLCATVNNDHIAPELTLRQLVGFFKIIEAGSGDFLSRFARQEHHNCSCPINRARTMSTFVYDDATYHY